MSPSINLYIVDSSTNSFYFPLISTQIFPYIFFCNMTLRLFTRTLCQSKFRPIGGSQTLDHIHFGSITPFEEGEKVQKMLLNANLDFKRLETIINRKRKEAESQGHILNEHEELILSQIMRDRPKPTLLTFEFENVYTGGKQMKKQPEAIRQYEQLAPYHQLERGGKVTWHGRGQLVAYPILDLKQFTHLSPRCYVDSVIIQAVQNTLRNKFNLESFRRDDPGVFMTPEDDKIASVGCNIQHGITSYGISLNINPDLKFLNTFEMCGLPGTHATSVAAQNGPVVPVAEAATAFAKELAEILNIEKVRTIEGNANQQ